MNKIISKLLFTLYVGLFIPFSIYANYHDYTNLYISCLEYSKYNYPYSAYYEEEKRCESILHSIYFQFLLSCIFIALAISKTARKFIIIIPMNYILKNFIKSPIKFISLLPSFIIKYITKCILEAKSEFKKENK